MGADARLLGLLLAGIADQFDMLVGFLAVEPVKGILRSCRASAKRAAGGCPPGHLLLPVVILV